MSLATSLPCSLPTASQAVSRPAALLGLLGRVSLHVWPQGSCRAQPELQGSWCVLPANPAWRTSLELSSEAHSGDVSSRSITQLVSLAYPSTNPVLGGTGLWPHFGVAAEARDALQVVLGPRLIPVPCRRSPGITAPSRTEHLWLRTKEEWSPRSPFPGMASGFLGSFWSPPSPSPGELVLVITAPHALAPQSPLVVQGHQPCPHPCVLLRPFYTVPFQ